MEAENAPFTVINLERLAALFLPPGTSFEIRVQASDLEGRKDLVFYELKLGEHFLLDESLPDALAAEVHKGILETLLEKGYVNCAFEKALALRECPRCGGPLEVSQPYSAVALYCEPCEWSVVSETLRSAYSEFYRQNEQRKMNEAIERERNEV